MFASGKKVVAGGGHSYVNRDAPAAPDFEQIALDDFITAQNDFHLIDTTSGDFVNDGVKVGDWVSNATNYAQVTAINSATDLTLDANIFPADDGARYLLWRFNGNAIWSELDLSGIIDADAVLVRVKFRSFTGSANTKFQMRKLGETDDNYSTYMPGIANAEQWGESLVAPDGSGVIEYKTEWSGPTKQASHYLEFTVLGWWV